MTTYIFGSSVFKGPRLTTYIDGRDNNFNLLRMIAATCVLISHAFPLTLGQGTKEPLQNLLNGITLGGVAVMVFFAVSGFLIARSFDRSRSLKRFVLARVLRLFPALFVVLALTVLVTGIWFTDRAFADFAADGVIYIARNMTLYFLSYPLPGVFENNPYGPPINGSLWTLNYEVTAYCGVVVLGLLGALRNKWLMLKALFAFAAVYLAVLFAAPDARVLKLAYLAAPFVAGTAFYVWRNETPLSLRLGLALAAMALLAHPTPLFTAVFSVALAYWVLLAAYLPKGRIRQYNAIGDYSYGLYLYAFPIQQMVSAVVGPMTPYENMAIAFPIALACAIASWICVEKPALAYLRERSFPSDLRWVSLRLQYPLVALRWLALHARSLMFDMRRRLSDLRSLTVDVAALKAHLRALRHR